ncbi:MAG: RHS repeat-associated core domain-containing protein [Nitrospiraceae bacterium]
MRVTVSPAPTQVTDITLTSTDTSRVVVPSMVAVPAGALFADFVVTTPGEGSALVTANLNGSQAQATVTVTPAEVVLLTLAPTDPTIFAGESQAFTATGTFTDGTTQNLTNTATWTSSNEPVATINSSGLATSLIPGTTTITASVTNPSGPPPVTASTTLTVLPPPPLEIVPPSASLQVGETLSLTIQSVAPAGVGGLVITLAQSGAGSVTLPATVTMPEGQNSVPVNVTGAGLGSVTLTASAVGRQSATATLTVTLNVPTITSFNPTSGQVGTTVTLTGTSFDPTAANNIVKFNGVTAAVTAATATTITTAVPSGATTGPITVTNAGGTGTSAQPFTVVNSAPVFTPIGNQTIALGSTLTFTATALDPDLQNVAFAVTPLPLPAHAAFDVQSGVFTFAPDTTQVGAFTFTFSATDGAASSTQTITVTVTGAPPGGVTALFGRVDDTSQHPLANLPVTLKGTALTTTTNAQGEFTLSSSTMPTGRQVLVVDGFAQGFAVLAAPVDINAGVTNQIPQPLTLPPVDLSTQVTVNPAATTVVTSATLNVSVTIPPNTAKNANGTNYTGVLTISPVPEYGRVEARPVELRPGLSITIQPAGVAMAAPVPITFPNVDAMPANKELDLWSLSPDTGTFNAVGKMRVSADGQRIETISGGVRTTAWHFVLAAPAASQAAATSTTDQCTECGTGSGSDLSAGALSHDVTIPGIRTLGVARDLTLHYRSTSADVRPILPINASLGSSVAVPQTFSARLTVGGIQQGPEVYWNASGLPPAAASTFRLGVQFDASTLNTGRYVYEMMLFSNYAQSSIGGGTPGKTLVRNERTSPFGSGWTLTGLDRLLLQSDGSLVLAKGSGGTDVFVQTGRPLVIESFGLTRSVVTGGVNNSFVAGGIYAQARADLLNPANFGPAGVVPRTVTLRSGLNTLSLPALAGADIMLLNSPTVAESVNDVAVLEQFVQQGGAILEARNFGLNRAVLLNTFPGPFTSDTLSDFTSAGLASVLRQGPFGTATNPLSMGAHTIYAVTGSFTEIARSDPGPDVLLLQPGAGFGGTGRAVFIGDEEIFANGFVTGGSNLYSFNQTFFLNTIAFLAGTPGYLPPVPPGTTSQYAGPSGDFSLLVKNTDGTFTRTLKDGTKFQFNAQGLQTAATDRNNNTTNYAYDAQGRLTTITDPAGQVTTLAYSGTVLASITDSAGRVTQLAHDSDGNLTAVTYADSTNQTFVYDPQRRMMKRTDAQGKVYQYQYDYAGRFSQAMLPTGETRKLSPSQRIAVPNVAAGQGTQANPAPLAAPVNAASFTDANNRTTTFELDANLGVTKQTDALNRTTNIVRDANQNPTQITRPNSAVTTMTYDAKGNLLTSTEQAITATTTFTYEPTFNQVTSIKDPKNNLTTMTYDAKGNPLTITDADNKVTTFTYDSRGLLLTSKDALNQTTSFTYDAQGRLLTTTDPLNRTTTLTYDAAGNVATSTDALTRVTTFTYDAFNRLKTVTDPATGVTTYTYDGNGNLLTVKDAKNQTTTFVYDNRNRLASTTDPLGKTESYTYDGNDNLLTRITPKAETISFAYDVVNQLLSKTLPGSLVTSYTYDNVGNLTGVTDPDSALTMAYDLANRLTSVKTDGSSNQPAVTLTYGYDKAGNRLSLGEATGTNAYSYDVLNRLAALSSPTAAGSVTSGLIARWPAEGTAQDVVGGQDGALQNGATFAAGPVGQAFSFDGVNDQVSVPNSAALNPTAALTLSAWVRVSALPQGFPMLVTKGPTNAQYLLFVNGAAGAASGTAPVCFRINVGVSNPTNSSQLVLKTVCSTTLITYGQNYQVTGTYDGATLKIYVNGVLENSFAATGAIATDTRPLLIGAGDAVLFGGGQSNQLQGVVDEVQIYNRALTTTESQALGQQSTTTYAYDAISRRTSAMLPNGTQTTYTYDPASQVTNILHKIVATSAQINKADYVYNNVGNRMSLTDRRGAQAFGYDSLDRLTSASHPLLGTPQAFSYDPVGNRTTGGSTHNVANQLTADANFTYQYDDNGSLTRKTITANANYTQYTYDAENRLTKVEEFTAGSPTPVATSTYRYDGLGRRIEKVGNGQTRRYVYDGEDILLEYDGGNVLQARHTHGPGIDVPIAVTKAGSTFFYHQDGLGTVTDLTDSAGAVAKAYAYDSHGNILESPGTVDQPYTFTGREFDAETGLYYYRARYYDPTIGRYISEDPIGFNGGIDFYAYVLNNPINRSDQFGLAPKICCRGVGWGLSFFGNHCYIIPDKGQTWSLRDAKFLGLGPGVIDPGYDKDKGGECEECKPKDCKDPDQCFARVAGQYPNGGRYNFGGPNSNTFAARLAKACCAGGFPAKFQRRAIGWDADIPYPKPPNDMR